LAETSRDPKARLEPKFSVAVLDTRRRALWGGGEVVDDAGGAEVVVVEAADVVEGSPP